MNPYDDTSPSNAEVERLTDPVDGRLLTRIRDVTEPEAEAVARLIASRPRQRSAAPMWVAMAAAAMALVAWRVGSQQPQTIPAIVADNGGSHEIAPGVVMAGIADVSLVRSNVDVVELAMVRGTARFSPGKSAPELRVSIDDVRVESRGADLEITVLPPNIRVDVYHGTATAHADGTAYAIAEGDRWTWPIAAVVAPEPVALVVPSIAPVLPSVVAPVPTSDHADATAYAAILDAADRHEPPGKLIASFDKFLAAYPASPLVAEAGARRMVLALDYDPPKRAMTQANRWLDANKESPRRLEVLEAAARNATARLHDCEKALPLWEEIREKGEPARADAWIGLCNVGLGRNEEAEASLRRALEEGVSPPLLDKVVAALTHLEPK